MRILHLTLKKKWFDMVASGDKKEEYRKCGKWIESRLKGKTYDIVRFRNGYAPTSPIVDIEYIGTREGGGLAKWGAEPAVIYQVICLGDVMKPITPEPK